MNERKHYYCASINDLSVTKTYQTYPGCLWWEQICWDRTESPTHQQEALHTVNISKLIAHCTTKTKTKNTRVKRHNNNNNNKDTCGNSFHSYIWLPLIPSQRKLIRSLCYSTNLDSNLESFDSLISFPSIYQSLQKACIKRFFRLLWRNQETSSFQ